MKRLSSKEKKLITDAIQAAENQTSGEIRVHLSYSKCDEQPLQSAKEKFEKLKMHLTEQRNGMLLYINPRAKKFALFGDTGIHEKVGQDFWNQLKQKLSQNIKQKDLVYGITLAVTEMGQQLKTHYPSTLNDQNELSNDISESE